FSPMSAAGGCCPTWCISASPAVRCLMDWHRFTPQGDFDMPQHQDPVVIVSAARTPMGAFQGDFSDLAAHDLGGAAIQAAVARAGIAPEQVEEVLFGNCLMAGQGQAPARQAGFKGGLPQSTGAVTLSKMCGAGMEATIIAHDQLIAGSRD